MPVTPWKRLSSRPVLKTPWFTIRQDACELPGGSVINDYYVAERADVVSVVAITPDNRLLVNKQYKHGIGEIVCETPGGMVNPNEDLLRAVQRELEEETGYQSTEWINLGTLIASPTTSTNRYTVFLATQCIPTGKAQHDPREEIECIKIPLEQAINDPLSVPLNVMWTLAALQLARPELERLGILRNGTGSGILPLV